jgi:ABC-2 type transport system permease protein
MNPTLLRRSWRANRVRVLLIAAALVFWGFLLPVIYAQFGTQFQELANSGILPKQLTDFGGGDIFSLAGAIALGFVHPISVALVSVFAVGFSTAAIAGERQRGTLEVLLARPISRHATYLTQLVACLGFVGLVIAAQIVGSLAGSVVFGVSNQINVANLIPLWLNGLLLYGAFASIGLAASVSFDRLSVPLGITIGAVLLFYFLQILGSLWPDAAVLQPYSLFHYLQAKQVLTGVIDPVNFAVLAIVLVGAAAFAWWEFPRRDLAAPS